MFSGSIFALLLCLQLSGMLKYFDTKIKLLLLIRSCKAMTNISYGNSEKRFLECENYRFKKYLLALTQLTGAN